MIWLQNCQNIHSNNHNKINLNNYDSLGIPHPITYVNRNQMQIFM